MSLEEVKQKIQKYVEKYWKKTGTAPHPDSEITQAVVEGLARNLDELGRPLCLAIFTRTRKKRLLKVVVGYVPVMR